ncbi:PREDICTED: protein NSP-INTERACTING KINASE 1-like [Fragaria vesca subsp. vesca]
MADTHFRKTPTFSNPLRLPPLMSLTCSSENLVVGLAWIVLGFRLVIWWRQRRNKQAFFDVKDKHQEISLGNLKRFHFRELQIASNNFSNKSLLGKGGFGQALDMFTKELSAMALLQQSRDLKIQFQTEVELISLAVHRNQQKGF